MSVDALENYELDGLLGEGGIGQVYAAHDKVLGRRVAIKALRPELASDRNFIDRFYSEARSLANLNHSNITTLHALHVEGNKAFMVMELIHGQTIEALLSRVGRLTLRDSLAVLAQAVPGIRYAHRRGIIHRDLKPANLMLTDDGIVKIMDFGIARVQGSQHLTRVGEFCGTFVYASPEQIRGEEVDERSDLYSLAIVLYRMLAGNPPFTSTNEYALMTAQLQAPPPPLTGQVPGLDAATEAALMRALAKRPEERFASVEEFGRVIGAMAMRGESIDILQQLYAHAFAPEDPETTRILSSTPPPMADPTMPSKPSLRNTTEWQLPPSPSISEASVPPTESTDSGRRPMLEPTQLQVPPSAASEPGHPRPTTWAITGMLLVSMLLGGGYLAFYGVLPDLLFSAETQPVAATNEPAAPASSPEPPEAAEPQIPPSPPPSEVAKHVSAPPTATPTTENGPLVVPSPEALEAVQVQPSLSLPRVETRTSEPPPSAPPVPVETAKAQPVSPSAPAIEPAKPEPPEPSVIAGRSPPTPPPQIPADASYAPPSPSSPAQITASEPAQAPVAKNEPKPTPSPVPPSTQADAPPPAATPPSPTSAAPVVVAKTEPAPSPEARTPIGPGAEAGPPKPEGEPDLEGKVSGAKRLDEIEIAGKWIKIYGIVDRARGAREAQHVKVLIGYLKRSGNHLVCYRKRADTYRCYSDGHDIARLALQDGMVGLAANAPAEYRSLLPARR